MAFDVLSIPKRFYKTFSNLRTGIVLLILVVIAAAMGTFILQRPASDVSKLQRRTHRKLFEYSTASDSPMYFTLGGS